MVRTIYKSYLQLIDAFYYDECNEALDEDYQKADFQKGLRVQLYTLSLANNLAQNPTIYKFIKFTTLR